MNDMRNIESIENHRQGYRFEAETGQRFVGAHYSRTDQWQDPLIVVDYRSPGGQS